MEYVQLMAVRNQMEIGYSYANKRKMLVAHQHDIYIILRFGPLKKCVFLFWSSKFFYFYVVSL